MTIIIYAVGLLVGGSLLAMLWLSFAAVIRRFTRRRLDTQSGRLRKLLSDSRQSEYEGLAKMLFEMRDTFDPEVLDGQLQKELLDAGDPVSPRLLKAVDRLGLGDRYLDAVRKASSWRDRAQAAHALGAIGEARAATALVEGMQDPREDRDVKLACAEALGRIKNPDVIPLLCAQLGDVNEWSSPRIAAILTNFGDAATTSLLATLDEGESLNARVWAAQILGKIGARRAVDALRDRLHDRSEQMRISAANALGDIDDVRSVRSLIDIALRDPTPAVRAQAAQSLGKLGDPEALPILVAALGDPEYWMRFRALEAIEALKPDDISTIELALGDISPEVRRRAALALERLGLLDAAFTALSEEGDHQASARERLVAVGRAGLSERFVRHLNDESGIVREAIADILGEVGDPNHAPELEKRLKDDVPGVRRAAARALGALAVEPTAPSLIALLVNNDAELAGVAVDALRHFGGTALVPQIEALAAIMSSESDRARVRATDVLADVPGSEVDELLLTRGLGDRFVEVRLAAVKGLGSRKTLEAVEPVGALLADPYEPLRVAAAEALSDIGGDRAVDFLLGRMPRAGRTQREAICRGIAALGFEDLGGALDILLGETDINARIGATWILGNTGSANAVPLLAALAKDSEARVRSSAVGALSKISGVTSYEALRDSHSDPNQFVRAAVVNAIGARGSVSDFSILETRSSDPDDFVRNRAVVAMGRIGGPEAPALIEGARDACAAEHRILGLGLSGDPQAIGDAVAALEDSSLREEVASLLASEVVEIREQFVSNLGLAHGPDALRDAFAASLEPSPLIEKMITELRNHNVVDTRLRALRTLARLATKEATVGLAAAARNDPSPAVRVAAVVALAERTEDVDALRVLTSALDDPASDVRANAIRGLGHSGALEDRAPILEALGSSRREVAEAGIAAASSLYASDMGSFIDWLADKSDPAVVADGLAVLRDAAAPESIDLICQFSVLPQADVRVAAVRALASFSELRAARALLERIADPDPRVRREAIGAAPSGPDALVALRSAAVDPDAGVRSACALRLGNSDTLDAIEILEGLASDRNADVAATALCSLVSNHGKEWRTAFIRACAEAGEAAIARAFRDESAAIAVIAADVTGALTADGRKLALEVLVSFDSVELADDIASALTDPEPGVRLAAARGLAEIGVERLDDRLRALVDDPVADVRAEVRRLLIRPV